SPDREVRGVGGVPNQHYVLVMPPPVGYALEVEPARRVEIGYLVDQRLAVEMSRENALEHRDALGGTELIEAESKPGFRWAFDDEGAHLVVEAVGMAPDPPRDRSLERKREGAEDPPGAQPDVLVAAHVDLGSEAVRPLLPQAATDAVASNN